MKTKLRKKPKPTAETLVKVLMTIYGAHEYLDSSMIDKAVKIASETQLIVDQFYQDESNYG